MYKIYEDEYTLAFLDISNDVDGHTLIVPKKHFVNVLDIDNFTLEKIIATTKKVANHYVDNCGFEGVNILNASGEEAGQSVFHLHFHIFPRKKDDGANLWFDNKIASKSLEEMKKLLEMD
jgi:histidine triad (HIT) family protein